jgi:hypothetical protein
MLDARRERDWFANHEGNSWRRSRKVYFWASCGAQYSAVYSCFGILNMISPSSQSRLYPTSWKTNFRGKLSRTNANLVLVAVRG